MGLFVAAEAVVSLVVGVPSGVARRVPPAVALAQLIHGLAQGFLLGVVVPHALLFQLVLDVLGAALVLIGDLVDVDLVAHGSPPRGICSRGAIRQTRYRRWPDRRPSTREVPWGDIPDHRRFPYSVNFSTSV